MNSSINPADIDSFLDRVETVEQELKALMRGDVPPSIKSSPSSVVTATPQLTRPEPETSNDAANRERWKAERRVREASEERDRWWRLAELQFGLQSDGDEQAARPAALKQATKSRVPLAPKDYKKWDSWVPQDPATLAEEEAQRRAKDALADAEFEAANAGFVESFKADAERRQAQEAEKVSRAVQAKERGNAAFKLGNSLVALSAYHEALLLTPFNVALLNNIALVHLQEARRQQSAAPANAAVISVNAAPASAGANSVEASLALPVPVAPSDLEEAVEFSRRALRVDPRNTKALFRRATANLLRGDLTAAGSYSLVQPCSTLAKEEPWMCALLNCVPPLCQNATLLTPLPVTRGTMRLGVSSSPRAWILQRRRRRRGPLLPPLPSTAGLSPGREEEAWGCPVRTTNNYSRQLALTTATRPCPPALPPGKSLSLASWTPSP